MALWPFSKKKDEESQEAPAAPVTEVVETTPLGEDFETPDPLHDAVDGARGPFDANSVSMDDFDFSDFSAGILDLGSMQIPLPMRSEVQVEMGPEGPRLLHIVTEYGRITPVAFAAPRTAGQWREACRDIAEGMRADGLDVTVERGPWGREVVGRAGDAVVRMIGVDGPRWLLRMTLAGPADRADNMAALGREVVARTFVVRGNEPFPPGNSLPIQLPEALANQVRNAMEHKDQWVPQVAEMEEQRRAQAAAAAEQAAEAPAADVPERSAFDEMKAQAESEGESK
ncbi:DUF3710 domain-containing protein [Corynebacterium sp. 13CS0277]|uniref:DUF3710 domain-containing protein n=1 Tax=Corynebacterium sp. 13CS0277 TaxID=2071994 RepID=UPI000D02A237|nr:DUF3710 domain-containing protein [Corynebacterium sp. 13CS0277]PRQ10353.1 DUF3710 domain-containing protein [Corynebacterium sp. 13CS0277]